MNLKVSMNNITLILMITYRMLRCWESPPTWRRRQKRFRWRQSIERILLLLEHNLKAQVLPLKLLWEEKIQFRTSCSKTPVNIKLPYCSIAKCPYWILHNFCASTAAREPNDLGGKINCITFEQHLQYTFLWICLNSQYKFSSHFYPTFARSVSNFKRFNYRICAILTAGVQWLCAPSWRSCLKSILYECMLHIWLFIVQFEAVIIDCEDSTYKI